ncbi:AMP-binding protein [Lacticaseibacillus zhaodongensis]|uniref:AMP-binding protein n=1 Tax=Lacticaseibacillus zhaodongensis TaxID=2668065 RepID=UPI0012D30748|nr:AMP-binding protein [Lacticaseibacillus zhaodongensis]
MTRLTDELHAELTRRGFDRVVKDEERGQWFTGADIEHDVRLLTQALRAANIGRDDVVFMSLQNSAVYLPINQALWYMGATIHPIAPSTGNDGLVADFEEFNYPAMLLDAARAAAFDRFDYIKQTKLDGLLTFPGLILLQNTRHSQPASHAEPTEETLGMILNTSGTTGKPKRVGLTHKMMIIAAHDDLESHELVPSDTVLIVMPMFHINAQLVLVLSSFLAGGKMVIAPKFSARKFWPEILDNDVTWSSVVPTIVTILLKNERANAAFRPEHKLRFIRCASSMLTLGHHREFVERFGVPILEGYGMTESCSQCTLNPLRAIKRGSAGKPYKTDVAIVSGDRFVQTPDVHGQIAVRGDHVITHYLDPHPDAFKDGWLLTGDLGHFDKDGYLFVEGRSKDIINHGGEKVSPAHVANVIEELDFVRNVTVVPVPDEIYGEAVAAAVIDGSQDPAVHAEHRAAIKQITEEKLAKYERPTQVYFVDAFPLNPTGKILRPQLSKIVTAMSEN